MSETASLPLLHPRHWPAWIGLGLLRALCATLPVGSLQSVGKTLGRLAMHLMARRRRIAEINLGLCFPELGTADRENLLRRHFESLGAGIIELGLGWWAPDARLRNRIQLTGMEHLREAFDRGKGVILLSAHFTTLEIGGRFLAMHAAGLPLNGMYRPNENPVIEHAMRAHRTEQFGVPIRRDDVRAMTRALKNRQAVWYAFDQNYGLKNSVFAPFFGIPAATNTATSRLAELTGAAVVPFFTRRLADGTYVQRIEPALQGFPSGDVQADATRLNVLIEGWVREVPEQYLWTHRRFKDRPNKEPRFY
jgi:KDO2-lipid IV(A) lauroyltransferase